MLEDMVKNDCAKFGLVTIFFTDDMQYSLTIVTSHGLVIFEVPERAWHV